MATLYLHIGMPKTGTTAIQRFCRINKAALAAKGCCYPIFPRHYPGVRIQRNGHFLVRYMEDVRRSDPGRERRWRAHMRYIAGLFRRYSSVVLSDENLWHAAKFLDCDVWERLRDEALRAGFEVKLIVYLRRQDLFLRSWWAQQVKQLPPDAPLPSWEELIARPDDYHALDYYAQLERLASAFGRESISARVYERGRFLGGDVVSDFLGAIGVARDASFVEPKGDPNASLEGDALALLWALRGRRDLPRSAWPSLRDAALACAKHAPGKPISPWSPEARRALLARWEASNRRVARDYLGKSGALFAPPEEPSPQPPIAEVNDNLRRLDATADSSHQLLNSETGALRDAAESSPQPPIAEADALRVAADLICEWSRLRGDSLPPLRRLAARLRRRASQARSWLRILIDYILHR